MLHKIFIIDNCVPQNFVLCYTRFVIPAGVITWPDLCRSHLILARIIKYKPDAQIGYSVSTGFCETGLKRVEPVAPVLNSVFENRTGSKLYLVLSIFL